MCHMLLFLLFIVLVMVVAYRVFLFGQIKRFFTIKLQTRLQEASGLSPNQQKMLRKKKHILGLGVYVCCKIRGSFGVENLK